MNDYTLYLVKRAYYKKQLIKRAAQANYNIDPLNVYDMKAQEIADAVKYNDANKLRLRDQRAKEYAKRYGITHAIGGGLASALAGAAGGALLDGGSRGMLLGGLGAGLAGGLGGYYYGKHKGHKVGYDAGTAEGTKLDNKDYETRKAQALADFNMEQTGSLHPSDLQKTKAGVRIYDSL